MSEERKSPEEVWLDRGLNAIKENAELSSKMPLLTTSPHENCEHRIAEQEAILKAYKEELAERIKGMKCIPHSLDICYGTDWDEGCAGESKNEVLDAVLEMLK